MLSMRHRSAYWSSVNWMGMPAWGVNAGQSVSCVCERACALNMRRCSSAPSSSIARKLKLAHIDRCDAKRPVC